MDRIDSFHLVFQNLTFGHTQHHNAFSIGNHLPMLRTKNDHAAGHGANHSSALVAHISTFFRRVTWYRDRKYAGSCMQTAFLGGTALTLWVGHAPSVSSGTSACCCFAFCRSSRAAAASRCFPLLFLMLLFMLSSFYISNITTTAGWTRLLLDKPFTQTGLVKDMSTSRQSLASRKSHFVSTNNARDPPLMMP